MSAFDYLHQPTHTAPLRFRIVSFQFANETKCLDERKRKATESGWWRGVHHFKINKMIQMGELHCACGSLCYRRWISNVRQQQNQRINCRFAIGWWVGVGDVCSFVETIWCFSLTSLWKSHKIEAEQSYKLVWKFFCLINMTMLYNTTIYDMKYVMESELERSMNNTQASFQTWIQPFVGEFSQAELSLSSFLNILHSVRC